MASQILREAGRALQPSCCPHPEITFQTRRTTFQTRARALHRAPGDLPGMRALIRATQPLYRYQPGDPAPWRAAARRLSG